MLYPRMLPKGVGRQVVGPDNSMFLFVLFMFASIAHASSCQH